MLLTPDRCSLSPPFKGFLRRNHSPDDAPQTAYNTASNSGTFATNASTLTRLPAGVLPRTTATTTTTMTTATMTTMTTPPPSAYAQLPQAPPPYAYGSTSTIAPPTTTTTGRQLHAAASYGQLPNSKR